MSNPLKPLSRSHRPGFSRSNTMIRSNKDMQEDEAARAWTPPPLSLADTDDFTTTEANFDVKFNRAVITLKHLLADPSQLMEQPGIYMFDITLFRYLSSKKHCKVQEHVMKSTDKFMELGLVKLYKILWSEHLNTLTDPNDWNRVSPDTLEAVYHISMALWFISANPAHIHTLFDELCDFLVTIITSGLFKKNNTGIKRACDLLKTSLGMLYQFAKNINKTKEVLRQDGRLGYLQRITGNKSGFNKNVKGRCHMILAYILNETEQKEMRISESIISFMLSLLKDCLTKADHRSPTHNYDALEIVVGLNRLAVSDVNSMSIYDNQGIGLYSQLLGEGNMQEKEEACKGLWTLSFNELVSLAIQKDATILAELQGLTKSPEDSVRAAAHGCLWTVQELKDKSLRKAKIYKSGHIMISYSWSIQTQAKELKQILLDNGYRVWLDIENMNGSTLSAMSQAIEKAKVMLILLSEEYKDSPACRAEAEYAYKLQREFIPIKIQSGYSPDGWLGMLLGMKMTFDLSDSEQRETTIKRLLDALGSNGKGPPMEEDEQFTTQEESVQIKPPTTSTEKPSPTATKPLAVKQMPTAAINLSKDLTCTSWSEDEVNGWVKNRKISDCFERLGAADGNILTELKFMLCKEPKHYYKMLKEDLSLPTMSILRLTAAIRSLK